MIAVLTLASIPILGLYFDTTSVVAVVLETIIPLAFGAAWLGLSKLEKQFYEGRTVPPRNLPESGR
ncbi:hypothetical protein [Nodularia sp. UHCC 0506]|uniref:hypothetical protein n=1 Tax=Nodularia sp. UHCC 0506 TaxID=3110243 RepID=UPI002B219B6A|nr:hypothetical protein [Nodularia sp. UHCC 0506]MEA5514383.1 hypothetical protein [Nodularia sp. UHCC 0506]